MSLQYATEETPLGTAGSVKNAEDALRDEPFLVISGDALTDIDLTEHGQVPQGERRAGHRRAHPGAQPAGVRHRDRRRGRPDPAVPGEADLGPGVLGHGQHRHLRHGARGAGRGARRASRWTGRATCSPSCSSAARRSSATCPTATGRTSARTRATSRPRPTC